MAAPARRNRKRPRSAASSAMFTTSCTPRVAPPPSPCTTNDGRQPERQLLSDAARLLAHLAASLSARARSPGGELRVLQLLRLPGLRRAATPMGSGLHLAGPAVPGGTPGLWRDRHQRSVGAALGAGGLAHHLLRHGGQPGQRPLHRRCVLVELRRANGAAHLGHLLALAANHASRLAIAQHPHLLPRPPGAPVEPCVRMRRLPSCGKQPWACSCASLLR